jgi:hypothetical protein
MGPLNVLIVLKGLIKALKGNLNVLNVLLVPIPLSLVEMYVIHVR